MPLREVKVSACREGYLPQTLTPMPPPVLGRNNLPTHFQILSEERLGGKYFQHEENLLRTMLLIFNIRKQAQKDEVIGTKELYELMFMWHQHLCTSCQRLCKH